MSDRAASDREPMGALFRTDGEVLLPGPYTRGPWYDDALHGSAMLAVMARAAEQHPSDVPRQVVRLTVDMMRAAPMAPLRTEVEVVRSGKSIDVLDIALLAGDEVFVQARALRLRTADIVVATGPVVDSFPVPPAGTVSGSPFAMRRTPGEAPAFHDVLDIHVEPAGEGAPTAWFRLTVPIVEGEPSSGFAVAATLCDWTYAVPMLALRLRGEEPDRTDAEGTPQSINVDTTISTFRPMEGGWLGIRSRSGFGDLGAGLSSAELFDVLGPLGYSNQSILVRGASGAPVSIREA